MATGEVNRCVYMRRYISAVLGCRDSDDFGCLECKIGNGKSLGVA